MFLYLTGLLQVVDSQGTKVLPVAAGLCVALIVLAAYQGKVGDDEGQPLVMAAVESLLVGFLCYFAGPAGGILMLPLALTALIAIEKGQQAAIIFGPQNGPS